MNLYRLKIDIRMRNVWSRNLKNFESEIELTLFESEESCEGEQINYRIYFEGRKVVMCSLLLLLIRAKLT